MTVLNTKKISLRTETNEDNDFLLQLYISTRDAEFKQLDWTQDEIELLLTQQFSAQYVSYHQLYPDAKYDLIEYEGSVIGRLYQHLGVDEFRLIDIALLPAFRNQKLGRYLIQTIQQSAAKLMVPVSLHVEYINPAYRLYRRLGFELVEDQGIYHFLKWYPQHKDF